MPADPDTASEAAVQPLKPWNTYRMLLNRVNTIGAVLAASDWPASPELAATDRYLSASR
jgi:hypothetical protein